MAYVEDIKKVFALSQGFSYAVELLSNKYVVINGHKGISGYDDEVISVKIKNGLIKVLGCNLKLATLTDSEVYISGNIKGVQFEN